MKTRAELSREYLSAKLIDRDTNFGMNEAYRTALDDMVAYIDLPKCPYPDCSKVKYKECPTHGILNNKNQ